MKKQVSIVLIVQLMIVAAAAAFGWQMHQRLEAGERKLKDLGQRIERLQQEAASERFGRASQETAAEQQQFTERLLRNAAERQQFLERLRHAANPSEVLVAPLTSPASPKPETPPGWVPFEFNGLTYYYTPLSGSLQVSANDAR